MKGEKFYITAEHINQYLVYLAKKGSAGLTIEKYNRDVMAFASFLNGKPATKETAEAWKNKLLEAHPVKSVNSMTAAVNSFAAYFGLDIKILQLHVRENKRSLLVTEANELTKTEFEKLMRASKESGNERLSLILSTICATGIQVSELSNVTVEAVESGEIEARLQRKGRTVRMPERLREVLMSYAEREGIRDGCIFITRSGKPCNRSNIWKSMKDLCETAEVDPSKVFPQNLRYLYVKTFYDTDKDAMLFP